MGKQHRRGIARTAADVKARHKRPCISAPAAMANFALTFHRVERNREKRWNAKAKWDPVTLDVAGRTLPTNTDGNARADGYQIELQACDASGDPVDLPSTQEDPFDQTGTNWTDVTGSSTVLKTFERRLEASGNVIASTNMTGLTAGIEETVQFFARCESGSPTLKCEVWNQTDSTSVVSKNQQTTEAHHGKLIAKMKFTPVAGKTYRLRVTWQSGTGKPIVTKGEWWDAADDMTWKKTAHDEDTKILFKELVRPKVYYYRARGRARINHHHRRCWSAWTSWTTAINPVTGNEAGMDPPDGVTLTFDRVGAKKHSPFRALVTWNEVGWWIPPMGDAMEGAKAYAVKLAASDDGGTTTLHVRHMHREARDADADTTADMEFKHIRRNRVYRAAVRCKDHDNNWGAWSAWTSWISPTGGVGSGPNNPLNVVQTKPRPRVIVAKWDEPTNFEDVDKYRVRVFQDPAGANNLRETVYTRGHHFRYHVPIADKGTAHRIKVTAIDHEANLSSEVDEGSNVTDDGADATEDPGSLKHYGGGTAPSGWLKCDGASYATATYPDLFAVIGYLFGGAGASFNVPDLRGRHSIGVGTAVALAGNDGVTESSRGPTHTHATDGTTDGTADFTSQSPGSDFTGEASHGHFVSNFGSDGPDAVVPRGTAASSAGGPAHHHNIPGHNTNSGANHNHGHDHSVHNHGHGHNHGHSHAHDAKTRHHLGVHFIIKT